MEIEYEKAVDPASSNLGRSLISTGRQINLPDNRCDDARSKLREGLLDVDPKLGWIRPGFLVLSSLAQWVS